MFEKEAIIHALEVTLGLDCLIKPAEEFTYDELNDHLQEKADDFQDGAFFGYNKAKEELQAQIDKMCENILDLLSFEDNLDPYMYECDDAQRGELLKPFQEARKLLKNYECKKCKGEGHILTKKWKSEIVCPSCKGNGYIFGRTKE